MLLFNFGSFLILDLIKFYFKVGVIFDVDRNGFREFDSVED